MVDLSTTLCGIDLRNPFVLASGPLSFDGAALLRAHRAGAGAVVTKTICEEAARNPIPHIAKLNSSLLNCELWSDLGPKDWLEREIPIAKEGGAVVIASIGMKPGNIGAYVRLLASSGADAIEVCSYDARVMLPMLKAVAQSTDLPILAKVSANWPDVKDVAVACLQAGASGITAIDSVGPTLRFDIEKRAPLLASGVGWLTGSAILPFSLRVVADIAMGVESGIVGTGGIHRVDDCVEMLMAGATAVGICSLPMVSGLQVFAEFADALSDRLTELGYARIQDAIGAGLPALKKCLSMPLTVPPSQEIAPREFFSFDGDLCVDCGACIRVCSYQARRAPDQIHDEHCRLCGLCSSACPTGALRLSTQIMNPASDEGEGN